MAEVDRAAIDMAAFGYGEAAIAAMRASVARPVEDNGLAIHPENVVAVKLLLATATQWRTVSLSTMTQASLRRTGLDYSVIRPTARDSGIRYGPDDFARLRILEAEALNAWNEEASR